MASELRVNTLKDAAGNNSIATSFVAGGSAKAWALFDQVSVALDSSFNIASTVDDSAGQWRLNFSNAMSDASYSWNTGEQDYRCLGVSTGVTPTTTQIKFYSRVVNTSTLTDVNYNNASVKGDLA